MEQFPIAPKHIHVIDYESSSLPDSVRTLKPVVFQEGDSYCCIWGSNPVEGIFGCGKTPQEALLDWDKAYQKAMPGE